MNIPKVYVGLYNIVLNAGKWSASVILYDWIIIEFLILMH